MTWLLLYLLPQALAYLEDGQRRYVLHAGIALLADVCVAHTSFAEIGGKPLPGEWTVSQMLERLCHPANCLHPDFGLFLELAKTINRQSPTGRHIKAVAP